MVTQEKGKLPKRKIVTLPSNHRRRRKDGVSSSGRERREIWNGLIDVDGYMDWAKRGERMG